MLPPSSSSNYVCTLRLSFPKMRHVLLVLSVCHLRWPWCCSCRSWPSHQHCHQRPSAKRTLESAGGPSNTNFCSARIGIITSVQLSFPTNVSYDDVASSALPIISTSFERVHHITSSANQPMTPTLSCWICRAMPSFETFLTSFSF